MWESQARWVWGVWASNPAAEDEEGLGKTRHSQSQFLQLQHWKKTQRFLLLTQGNLAVVVSFE